MRIWWYLSEYISHRRAGLAYRMCLQYSGHELTDDPEQADVVVLHDDPMNWIEILSPFQIPQSVPVVGYAVWEGQTVPDVYGPGFALVDAVWTASEFTAATFRHAHKRVQILPHVVQACHPSDEDRAWAIQRLHRLGECRYFFTIVDGLNPRKNLEALLRVFAQVHEAAQGQIALVVKQYRRELHLGSHPHVLSIGENLSDGQLAALHSGALAYVSPHRGEAWGLGMSEAMSHGKTVLATGWSGNMEFMDRTNSVPLRYDLEPVQERMTRMLPHYTSDMLWAAVDEAHMERAMLRLVRRGPDTALCRRAQAITERFSQQRIARKLDTLLRDLNSYPKNI